jgi:23S rRNA (guanosine2251-2'-O)-methyltransferase
MREKTHIYGRNSVLEAIETYPKSISEVFLNDNSNNADIAKKAKKAGIRISKLNEKRLPGKLESHVSHQGVVASANFEKIMLPYKDFIKDLEITNKTGLLIFGELQDPQNVGAAIRSAAAFGISGVLIPSHNQAPINGTVIKVSAGMAFKVPLVSVKNVNNTIEDLKKKGFWIYGLSGEGETSLPDEDFGNPTVFIVGNEGDGLRRMTAESCDTLLSIPIDEKCESINASASVAVTLYDWNNKK